MTGGAASAFPPAPVTDAPAFSPALPLESPKAPQLPAPTGQAAPSVTATQPINMLSTEPKQEVPAVAAPPTGDMTPTAPVPVTESQPPAQEATAKPAPKRDTVEISGFRDEDPEDTIFIDDEGTLHLRNHE